MVNQSLRLVPYRYHAINLHALPSLDSNLTHLPSQHKDLLFHGHAAEGSDHMKNDISSYQQYESTQDGDHEFQGQ